MPRGLKTIAFCAVTAMAAGPAQAFTFENGTIWPLSVSIAGAAPQVVPAEEVAFLFLGQCPNGCTLAIAVSDPTQSQAPVRGTGGEPPTILGNGDAVIVRARMAGGGVAIEVAGAPAGTATVAPAPPAAEPPGLTAPAALAPTLTAPAPPASTIPTPTPPEPTLVAPEPPTAPSGFVPPPPPPAYDGN